jgi:hypothetical protein
MNFFQEIALIERVSGGTSFLEDKDNEQHPFFEPAINYDGFQVQPRLGRYKKVPKQEQINTDIERLSEVACVVSVQLKHGVLSEFGAYMKINENYPDIFKFEKEILDLKPHLIELFDVITQF